MAASYVAVLQDEDLRKCLTDYGESVGPITETTRDLYRKRLIKILASDKSFNQSGIPNNVKANLAKRSGRFEQANQNHSQAHNSKSKSNKSPTSTSPRRSNREDDESSFDITESSSSSSSERRRSSRLSSRKTSPTANKGDFNNDTSRDFENSDQENLFYNQNMKDAESLRKRKLAQPLSERRKPLSNPSTTRVPQPNSHETCRVNAADHENDFYFESSDTEECNTSQGQKRPALRRRLNVKNFYKRLLALVAARTRPNSASVNHSSYYKDKGSITDISDSRWQRISSYFCQHISAILVIVTLVFFCVLSLVYLNILTKENCIFVINGLARVAKGKSFRDRDDLLVCGTNAYLQHGCISVEEAEKAVDIVNVIHDILSTNAGDYECGYPSSGRNLTVSLVKGRVSESLPGYEMYWLTALRMILANPHWNIRLYSHDGRQFTDASASDQVSLVHHMDTTEARLSLPCKFKKFMEALAWKVGILTVVFLAIYGIYILWKTYKRRKEEETLAVFGMVEQIIEILQSNYDKYSNKKAKYPYVAVPHIRDRLIKPSQRTTQLHIWDKAVSFVEANESRIRQEIQDVDGEQYNVWRWLPTFNDDGQVPKVWQGNALANRDKTRHFVSPTSCLKIRNMFDENSKTEDDWTDAVQEAIIEKCHGHCDIVHVAVDTTSTEGVVYVKCASKEDAGKAFRELHGWWFAGKLITAKFIKEERYHEHYPVARHFTEPMKPSDEKLSSVAERYYKSALEM